MNLPATMGSSMRILEATPPERVTVGRMASRVFVESENQEPFSHEENLSTIDRKESNYEIR